jgi:hypothetical protein
MRAGWERAKRSRWSGPLLSLFALACVVGGGLLVLSGGARSSLLVPASVFFGLLNVAHSVHRWRHPDWRAGEWWGRHPMLANALGGASPSLPGVHSRATDIFGAAVQFVVGAVFVLAGIGLAIALLAG